MAYPMMRRSIRDVCLMLVIHVTCSASSRGPQKSVMVRVMTGDSASNAAANAPFR